MDKAPDFGSGDCSLSPVTLEYFIHILYTYKKFCLTFTDKAPDFIAII